MTEMLSCDNPECAELIPDDEELRSNWLVVGWIDIGIDHACSIDCAKALLDAMAAATAGDTSS